jgi:beta-xylosidase
MRLIRTLLLLAIGLFPGWASMCYPAEGNSGVCGDLGDGTYANPILPGDFADPDVIRVGENYYLITSTFQYSPGMAIMESKDLVNWQYLGHCIPDITRIGPELNWNRMNRYNRGVYAGALRWHDGKFWMFTTTLDEGVFMTTAIDPAGPWSPLVKLTGGPGWNDKGWDDPCPIWDDDGQAYLLLSKPGKEWWTHLFKLSADGQSIDVASDAVVDNYHGSEGNKIYKINGLYYIFHNQIDGPGNRTGVFMRSKSLAGPWEKKLFLYGDGPKHEREPNQGGLVQTPGGSWWFITHQGQGGYFEGRPCSLLPVQWVDGWPVVDAPTPRSVLVWRHRKPVDGFPVMIPQSSDEFSTALLGPQWEWNYQPRAEKWSLIERPGFLRLKAFPPLQKGNFFKAANTLTQRVMGYEGGEVTVKLDPSGMADGQVAGLTFFWKDYAILGAAQRGGVRRVQLNIAGNVTEGPELPPGASALWLQAQINDQAVCTFAYSLDGKTFTPIGGTFALGWANYRGARVGLCCFNDEADAGFVDVDWFHYTYRGVGSGPAAHR